MIATAAARIELIKSDQGTEQTAQTTGFVRRELVARPGVWIGTLRTPPGSVSGWHHHGDYDTYIHLQVGRARMEFGLGGQQSCVAALGDIIFVPKGAIHREANPGEEDNLALLVRLGSG